MVAGCGYTGTALGLALASEGHEVWGLRRSPECLPAPIRPVAADLAAPAGLADLPGSVDAVVFAASADASEPEAYRRAYVTGLANLARAVRAPGARLAFVSSTAVYGERGGKLVDEDTEPEPDGFRGDILLEAEEAARDWDGPVSVVRASGIYGPGRDRLVRLAKAGESIAGDRWTNRIHRDDLVAAIRHALTEPSPSALYLASDREPALLGEVLAWLAVELGGEPPARRTPAGRGAGDGNPPLPGRRCVGRRLPEEGFLFGYPSWREGYRSLIRGNPYSHSHGSRAP